MMGPVNSELEINPIFFSNTSLAPNIYKIPSVLGSSREGPIRSAPAFSMTSRQKQKLPMCAQFPGNFNSFFLF